MKHSNDYWEQEAYWEMERRRAEKNRKTREQRRRERAYTSALIGGICFLLLVAILLTKAILGGGTP
jgi:hypothetical protein|nr:MAG TPA: hypothetical protein [Caudoviricetes sp.]